MSGRVTPAVRSVENAGVAFQLLEYDYDASADAIGLQAAQALGRSASTVFKTLIVALDSGELVCAITPSDTRLNLKAIASAAGAKKAELSDPKKAERITGYVVGGISPPRATKAPSQLHRRERPGTQRDRRKRWTARPANCSQTCRLDSRHFGDGGVIAELMRTTGLANSVNHNRSRL
jgi:Cys-tRNA(Pro) deacylase